MTPFFMWNKAISVLMPKKRKLSHLNGNHHFITTKNVVSPPSCINRLTSYIGLPCEQSLQHLICANMCFKKRYVTLVKLTFKCIQHLSINGSDFQKTNVPYWYLPLQSWFYSYKKILHHISNFYIALCKATGIWEPRLLSNLDTFMTLFQLNDPCIGRGPEKLSNAKYAFFCSLALYR